MFTFSSFFSPVLLNQIVAWSSSQLNSRRSLPCSTGGEFGFSQTKKEAFGFLLIFEFVPQPAKNSGLQLCRGWV